MPETFIGSSGVVVKVARWISKVLGRLNMKTVLVFLVFMALVWLPVLYKVYGWKEGVILTISLGIASYLIDKLILEKRRKKDSE